MTDTRPSAPSAFRSDADLSSCLLARFPGTSPPDWLRRWLDDGLGGVVLFAGNVGGPEELQGLVAELRAHNPAVLIAADEEGGVVTRLEARTGSSFPGNAALGAVGDVDLTRQVAASMGAMLAASGVNLNLAPVADVNSNQANPVIGVRSFGAEPQLAAEQTAAFVAGLQSCRVAACAKHFPGHGRAGTDSHLELPVVGATLDELLATDLVPFAAAIEAGVRSVMTAHVLFPAIDEVPATLSSRLLGGVLRHALGFTGVIITDALEMAAIGDSASGAHGAVRALAAGADLLCLPADPAAQAVARETLLAAIKDGDVPRSRVEESAARVRELARWARPEPTGAPDPAIGASAARRALLVDQVALPLAAAPYVIDAGGRMSSLLDDSAASLLGLLRERLPQTAGVRLTGPPGDLTGDAADLSRIVSSAAGRPLIVAVSDAHRRAWQRELLAGVLALRPDVIVVGTGTVQDRPLAGRQYLGTRGAGRANLTAAADLLAGRERAE
jgi:beta-N-acetylhexosaminidase